MKLGLTALRAVLGAVFFSHGAQKLSTWFGGHGLEGTAAGFDSIGLKPGKRNAIAAGASEIGADAMLATGFLTPLAASAMIGVQSEAIRTVHWDKGFFAVNGGYEFNLTLIAAVFALADVGPGAWSLDRAFGTERSGPLWALAALGAGLAGPRVLERLAPAGPPAAAPSPRTNGQPQAAQETVGSAS
jgi:putative oxidoreductase